MLKQTSHNPYFYLYLFEALFLSYSLRCIIIKKYKRVCKFNEEKREEFGLRVYILHKLHRHLTIYNLDK
ncbi:hypothetical protein V1477_002773 [Vespula maculifrons]|uniref:Uncharacterized protein n=1 Tax=Vespula maculifrons TaxID=7453 RepID=A0ABD2CYE5_VESMC